MKRHVFIIGSKGIPAKYGGFETFVDELVSRQVNKDIKYHVACLNDPDHKYHKADCFGVSVPNVGPAKAVLYDIKAMKYVIKYAKENNIRDGIVYVLACRIGPFFGKYVKKLHKLGFRVYVNPDGHEWLRAKWNAAIKKYWKLSEKLMVKHADLLICDSKNIENYIKEDYAKYNPATTFIPYGADTTKSQLKDNSKELRDFYDKHNLAKNGYYLMVGRFVPENNYEIVIREFMKSNTKRDLVIISNVEKNKFYNELLKKTGFDKDARIKFVGTIYGKQLLKKIRENSYAYIHGHSVGGTNPSLLEALASTKLNILYDCGFNREVAEDGAVYFGEGDGELALNVNTIDALYEPDAMTFAKKARDRININYAHKNIVDKYEQEFTPCA